MEYVFLYYVIDIYRCFVSFLKMALYIKELN